MLAQENPLHSCRAIVHFLRDEVGKGISPLYKDMLLRDLFWKLENVDYANRASLLGQVFQSSLVDSVHSALPNKGYGLDDFRMIAATQISHFNIGIVTMLDQELFAVLHACGVSPDAKPSLLPQNVKRGSYWFCSLEDEKTSYSVVVRYLSEAGNTPAAIAVTEFVHNFELDLILLVGIAAGPKDKVKLGDIVFADRVTDYENARWEIEDGKRIERPRRKTIDGCKHVILQCMRGVRPNFAMDEYSKLIKQVVLHKQNVSAEALSIRPMLKRGTIMAGEKLLADDSLARMRVEIDERIRAGNQEDSGFAQAAIAAGIPWAIFRGISDFGDPNKPVDDTWHFPAALAAASAAKTFILSRWNKPEGKLEDAKLRD